MLNPDEKYSKIKCIHTSKNSTVYSAFDELNGTTVALKTASQNMVDVSGYAKIQNEYRSLSKIHSEFVPKAVDYAKIGDDYFVVLEYCDGIALSDYMKNHRISIKEFLYLAQQVAQALLDIHSAGIIHNDISPANMIYSSAARKISIIDFGLSTEFSYEKSLSIEPNVSKNALCYISPEKTGRMNHTVDFRSDFYSLGITFFEMLCGRPPFESESPTQLVYMHLAKLPPVIKEINPAVPEMLSRITNKLMAKKPEERYSKAEGILFDLNQCLELLTADNQIAEFELGARDYSDRLEIPQKLYGRVSEIFDLMEAYREILKGGKSLVTIAGHSGIGKTSLVGELHKPIASSNGIFINGKFEQYNRNVPYHAISQAIGQFVDFILSENDKNIEAWKKRIAPVLQQDGRLLVDRIPRLALVAGELQNLTELSPIEERTRFKTLLQDLLAVIASPGQPLVIFIDDLHLADLGSLEIIEEIMSSDKISGLLIVACYRDNEVDDNHPLVLSMNKLIARRANIHKILLPGLALGSAAQMLMDTLQCNAAAAAELSTVIYSKTGGNPFYIKQFLKLCWFRAYIFLDKAANRWNWNIESIKACPAEENVVDFLIKNIDQIPSETKRLLSLAACIGQTFRVDILSAVSGSEIEPILQNLKQAVLLEVVYPIKNTNAAALETEFHFSHDRFQQAFYTILPEVQKNNIHYALAMHYEKLGYAADDNAEKLFIMAAHYFKVFGGLAVQTEKRRVSEILLRTAHVLSLNSAFDTAIDYLEQIIGCLVELRAEDDFAFLVYAEYHSALCSLAKYAEADAVYALLEKKVEEPIRLTDNCCLQAVSLSNRGRYKDAFMLGLALLDKLGVHFPTGDLQKTIFSELDLFYLEINKAGFAGIEGLPKAENELEFAIGRILNRICTAGLFYNPLYLFWALITSAKRVLDKGYTPDGLSLYGSLTLLLIPFRNDYKLSYNLVSSAMNLAEKNGYRMFRMYHLFSLINCHWNEDLKNSIPYARESCRGNISVGDFEFACFTYFTTQQVVLETCENLQELIAESDSALAFAEKHGNLHAYGSFICFRQLCKALIYKNLSDGSFSDDHFSESTHLEKITANPMALCFFYTLRALSAVIFLDFDQAFELTQKAAPMLPSITGFYLTALHNFLNSLSICKKIESGKCTEPEKAALWAKLSKNQAWLKERAADSAVNFQHLYHLIEAEKYMLENEAPESLSEYQKMLSLYEEAMAGAAKSNRTYHYALACELAGIQLLKSGSLRTATVYLKEAYSAYFSWGAAAKAAQMAEKYHDLEHLRFNSLKFKEERVFTGMPPGVFPAFSSAVDFAAIIKASQAISGETKLVSILEKLISVLLENSGAQDIYYLTQKEHQYLVQAEGHSEAAEVSILQSQPATPAVFPMKILNYVERTGESIIIDHAAASEMFGNDEHILSHHCKSVMCMPVMNKGALNGVLYLENNLLEGVFDRQRIEALKIIAVQLAISLENAYLFDHLQQLVDAKTSELREEITIRKNAEERLNQMANYDFLTNLPNRRMFQTYLDHSLKLAGMTNTHLAVLFVDLDGFKQINDKYGHDKGDAVLIETAGRLIKTVRSGDTVSRMGGDEFVIILENIKTTAEIEKVCSRIIEFVKRPIDLDGFVEKAVVTASIGISLMSFDGITAEDLISNADKAMYSAKNSGKNRYAFHSKQYKLPIPFRKD